MCEICGGSGFLKWIDAWAFKDAWEAGHVSDHIPVFRADMACPACRQTQASNTARAMIAARGQPFLEPSRGFEILVQQDVKYVTVSADETPEYPFTQ